MLSIPDMTEEWQSKQMAFQHFDGLQTVCLLQAFLSYLLAAQLTTYERLVSVSPHTAVIGASAVAMAEPPLQVGAVQVLLRAASGAWLTHHCLRPALRVPS